MVIYTQIIKLLLPSLDFIYTQHLKQTGLYLFLLRYTDIGESQGPESRKPLQAGLYVIDSSLSK